MRAQRWISILGIATLVGLLALFAWGIARPGTGAVSAGVNAQGSIGRVQRHPAPELRLRLFDEAETQWRLTGQRGKPVVINFWASWCQPCRTEAGALADAARDYSSRGIQVVGVNVWDEAEAARRFLAEFGVEYPNGRDEGGTAAVEYGVTGIPETFVVDAEGQVTGRWIGPVTRVALDELVGTIAGP